MSTAETNPVSRCRSRQVEPGTAPVWEDPHVDGRCPLTPGQNETMDFLELQRFLLSLVERVQAVGLTEAHRQLEAHLEMLRSEREHLTPEEDARFRRRFRKTLGELIYQSSFIQYCLDKPRGYAGDFVTQENLWQYASNPELCEETTLTPLGRLISQLTFRMDNPKANVWRIRHLREQLRKGDFGRVASIGSGSAIEYWDGIEPYFDKELYLLDQDDGALDRARKMLTSRGYRNVRYIHSDVIKFILKNAKSPTMPELDFVYSVGLFDYFSLSSARKMARYLWQLVAPGGRLLITNAHPDTSTRLWSEYACEWNLVYKTEQEMMTLAAGLQNVADVHLFIDEYRVYQYLDIRREG